MLSVDACGSSHDMALLDCHCMKRVLDRQRQGISSQFSHVPRVALTLFELVLSLGCTAGAVPCPKCMTSVGCHRPRSTSYPMRPAPVCAVCRAHHHATVKENAATNCSDCLPPRTYPFTQPGQLLRQDVCRNFRACATCWRNPMRIHAPRASSSSISSY